MVASYLQGSFCGDAHFVIIGCVGIATTKSPNKTEVANISFEYRLRPVRIERFVRIAKIGIVVGVLFQNQVHCSAHRRSAKLGRYNTFVNLNAVYHVYRDVVES